MKKVLLLWLLMVGVAYANWGGDAGGSIATGTFKALGTEQVEMRKEDLSIRLFRDRAQVQVDYILANTGEAVDVKAGFPCLGLEAQSKPVLDVEDYHLHVDGSEVSAELVKGDDGQDWKRLLDPKFARIASMYSAKCGMWWMASTVHFAREQSHRVRITYQSVYQHSDEGPSQDDYFNNDYFRYLLSTASAWKGPIQQGTITIEPVSVQYPITILPQHRFRKVGAAYVWRFTNLKPTIQDDIEVCLNNNFYILYNYSSSEDPSWYSFQQGKYFFDFHGFSAAASSSKPGYAVANLRDSNAATAWVAGKNGGINERVVLKLSRPTHVDQVAIIPGYAKSKELYFANNRVREVEVKVNGRHTVRTTLADEYVAWSPMSYKAYQLIDLGPYVGDARTITLTIKSVYRGDKYDDTCVSEVLLRKRLPKKPAVHGAR